MLALQAAASDDMLPQTLVFDEVEAGLGGRSAFLAGQPLRDLSRRCQVILITHEASIASLADQHFRVERDGDVSRVLEVDGRQRERELARMLAGDPADPEAAGLARSLLEANRQQLDCPLKVFLCYNSYLVKLTDEKAGRDSYAPGPFLFSLGTGIKSLRGHPRHRREEG